MERGFEIAYPLRDEEWGLRRFMLRDPSGTVVNVLSHIPREGQDHRARRRGEPPVLFGGHHTSRDKEAR